MNCESHYARTEPRLTDNWVQLALRFVSHDYGVRELKDRMSRDILENFEKSGIEIASSTYDVVGFPPVEVRLKDEHSGPPNSI